ncbi:DUF2442 domain-containing protein [Parahaliea mediterranea]|uniref:DUF2442 domain-containing protein n=1 Tax=Parahaliea mediterranea TaxID=651086 RepID=UPI000E2E5343|nr:DUF2442 domain-containing protein [Parahaliea mediterranea]
MRRVTQVETKAGYILLLTFDDGTTGDVCIADRLFGPMFAPLKDPALFAQARVDEFGAVCWPNKADLAPDALYRQITAH